MAPIIDKLEELRYFKKYQNTFDPKLNEFVSCELLEKEINETFNNKVSSLDQNDQFFHMKKNSVEIERKKGHQKNSLKDIEARITESEKQPKTKSVIEFDSKMACSVKAFAVKQNKTVMPKTRFFSGRMLMFAKLSLISFIYELIETFCFPNKKTKEIFEKYGVDYVYLYHILTDTDSTSLMFLFVCENNSSIGH